MFTYGMGKRNKTFIKSKKKMLERKCSFVQCFFGKCLILSVCLLFCLAL